jgi:hypothetical protein
VHTPETTPRHLQLSVTVGGEDFELEGDFTLPEAIKAMKDWAALMPNADQGAIDRAANKVSDSADQLRSAVETNTPAAPTLKDA